MGEYLNATTYRAKLDARHNAYTLGVAPIAYRDGAYWRQAVSDWEDGDAARPHVVTRAPIMVSVADGGDRRLHPTRELDRYFGIGRPYTKDTGSWQQVSFGLAVRTANHISWSRAQARVDVLHAGHYCKLGIELLQGYVPAGGQVAFPVSIQGLTRQGSNILADGVVVGRLRAPHVEDLANQEAEHRPVAWEFVNLGGQVYLLLTLPSLAGMARPYIDPTYTLPADGSIGDTSTVLSGPDTKYGSNTSLFTRNAAGGHRLALFRFDLSGIPGGESVTSDTLSLWNGVAVTANQAMALARILAANSAWTVADATWNYAVASTTRWGGDSGADGGADGGCSVSGTDFSAVDAATLAYVADTVADTEHQFSITPAQTELERASNNGLVLRNDDTLNLTWRSSDAASNRPSRVIVTTAAGAPLDNTFRRIFTPAFRGAFV